jgi:hypothetical protein
MVSNILIKIIIIILISSVFSISNASFLSHPYLHYPKPNPAVILDVIKNLSKNKRNCFNDFNKLSKSHHSNKNKCTTEKRNIKSHKLQAKHT